MGETVGQRLWRRCYGSDTVLASTGAGVANTTDASPAVRATLASMASDVPSVCPRRSHVRVPTASGRETTINTCLPGGVHLVRQVHSSPVDLSSQPTEKRAANTLRSS